MEKTIIIDGKEVRMRASALIPRLYRFKFGRDVIKDMGTLRKAFRKRNELTEDATEDEIQEAQMGVLDLEIFENVSWCMAKHADASIPDSPDEWLEGFNMFSIYEVLPEILDLWAVSNKTTAEPKKK